MKLRDLRLVSTINIYWVTLGFCGKLYFHDLPHLYEVRYLFYKEKQRLKPKT